MKETLQHHKDEIRQVAEIPAETQQVFQGNQRLQRGHKCWKIDGKTFDVKEAKYETTAVIFDDVVDRVAAPQRRVVMEKGYWYVLALNPRNALRKLNNMIKQMEMEVKRREIANELDGE
jgi:hypothetical protein